MHWAELKSNLIDHNLIQIAFECVGVLFRDDKFSRDMSQIIYLLYLSLNKI